MKIFCYTEKAIIAEDSSYAVTVRQIVNYCTQQGHEVTNAPLLRALFKHETVNDSVYFEKTLEAIHTAEFIVAEVSHDCTDMGFCIAYALARRDKKIIALVAKNKESSLSPFIAGNTMHSFYLRSYQTKTDIEKILALFHI
jgi:hypothetical protein